jgi:methyltransferase (TIGR00027 family)
MEENRASRTALGTATHRALHQLYDNDPKIFADPLAVRLAEEADPAFFAARRDIRSEPQVMLNRAGIVLRSRFTEDELARAAAGGVQQYVILGAGLDTFAYRQPPFARDLRIFEVDHPATQAWKRERLTAMGIADPANLSWVPVDFEHQTLLEGLTAAGFDAMRPSYFSWLGVIPYLTRPAIDATLYAVAALPPPTTITMSFTLPEDDLTGLDLETAQFVIQTAANLGEPSPTRFHAEELRDHLRDLGFSRVFHLTPADAATRYFSGRQDGLRAPEWSQLMSATV